MKKSFLEYAKEYVALFAFIVTIIGTGAVLVWRVDIMEKKVEKVEERQTDQNKEVLNEIKSMNTRLSTIEGFLKGKELTLKQN